MIADRLRYVADEIRFNLRIVFWAQAWAYGEVTFEEVPGDVRRALDQISIQRQAHDGGDAVRRCDLGLEGVGVPDGEGETWAEVAERLRRDAGTYSHPRAGGGVGGE